jgi:hypothetical protein
MGIERGCSAMIVATFGWFSVFNDFTSLSRGCAITFFFLLWLYGFRVSVGLQVEYVVLDLFIQLHVGVMGHPVVA